MRPLTLALCLALGACSSLDLATMKALQDAHRHEDADFIAVMDAAQTPAALREAYLIRRERAGDLIDQLVKDAGGE